MKRKINPRPMWKSIAANAEGKYTQRGNALRIMLNLADKDGNVDEDAFIARAKQIDLGATTPQRFCRWFVSAGVWS